MAGNVERTYQERILKVQIHIQNHLDDALSLESLAEVAHFSAYHFHRIFTAITGESVKCYLRRLRLGRATTDLLLTDLSLQFISERAGYDTQQSFHRAFKEVYGTTPKEFRDSKQEALISHAKEMNSDGKEPIVVIKKIDPITVAFARHVGSYQEILETWFLLANAVGYACISDPATEKISILYDRVETTAVDKLRYDACLNISKLPDFKPSGNIGVQTIRGGRYAVITHHGPLVTIEKTYEIIFGIWLPASGYEPDDFPNFVLHRTGSMNMNDENNTADIYLPIK